MQKVARKYQREHDTLEREIKEHQSRARNVSKLEDVWVDVGKRLLEKDHESLKIPARTTDIRDWKAEIVEKVERRRLYKEAQDRAVELSRYPIAYFDLGKSSIKVDRPQGMYSSSYHSGSIIKKLDEAIFVHEQMINALIQRRAEGAISLSKYYRKRRKEQEWLISLKMEKSRRVDLRRIAWEAKGRQTSRRLLNRAIVDVRRLLNRAIVDVRPNFPIVYSSSDDEE